MKQLASLGAERWAVGAKDELSPGTWPQLALVGRWKLQGAQGKGPYVGLALLDLAAADRNTIREDPGKSSAARAWQTYCFWSVTKSLGLWPNTATVMPLLLLTRWLGFETRFGWVGCHPISDGRLCALPRGAGPCCRKDCLTLSD